MSYSESYSVFLNGRSCAIADCPYVMSLGVAFHSLLQENYDKFILTVGSYAVAVFIVHNGVYKVFNFHSKDLLGHTDPLGTYTLIEMELLIELVQYFQELHKQTSNLKLRGINVFQM